MRFVRNATFLLAAPLLLAACNKAEAPAAQESVASTENAMDATTPTDVANSGVPEMSSGGPGIIPKTSSASDSGTAPTTNSTAPTTN